ncbi:MAG: Crp/Fnr family transcriptional regulator [Magnetovibrio sp.]|nr:Crp/Fnr family transcriptional regulator [Magnetovibrio sp.]
MSDKKVLNRKAIPVNSVIFREDDLASCAYLLKSGAVDITTEKDGKRVLLNTIVPNQLFGELALIDGSRRSATATATMPCEVIIVSQEDIERKMNDLDDFMKYWLEYLTERVRDLSKRIG